MTLLRRYAHPFWVLMTFCFLAANGCSSPPAPKRNLGMDQELARTNRAARTAFDNGKFHQAADLYQQALERAYLRDDLSAIVNAKYNLALCLTILRNYQAASDLVQQIREDLSRNVQPVPEDILLLEATILYRRGNLDAARRATAEILKDPNRISAVIQSKTRFLRGLIASDRNEIAQLRLEIEAFGKPSSASLQADHEELTGRLSMAEGRWDAAALAFDEAAALRRHILDYRGMARALAKAGEAYERAGRPAPASRRYLRAGQSAARQGDSDQARKWLALAARLADLGGDAQTAAEARLQMAELEEDPLKRAGDVLE